MSFLDKRNQRLVGLRCLFMMHPVDGVFEQHQLAVYFKDWGQDYLRSEGLVTGSVTPQAIGTVPKNSRSHKSSLNTITHLHFVSDTSPVEIAIWIVTQHIILAKIRVVQAWVADMWHGPQP